MIKAAYHNTRALWRIRKFTTIADSKNIAAAVAGSRLDYCNSLLYGVSGANLNKLQRVQNSLVRIGLSSDIRSNAKQNLADLHWLQGKKKTHYKIALLAFKFITTHRPNYLSDLLQFRTTLRHLRSSDHCLLHDAGARTVFGSRAFCDVAPTIWNSLPACFMCSLRTYFYKLSFATYSHKRCPCLRFVSLIWDTARHHQLHDWLIDWLIDWRLKRSACWTC